MRLAIIALALALGLAQCTSAQWTSFWASQNTATLQQETATFIADVQAGAATACKVVPTVAAILSVFNVVVGATVQGVVTAICAAVPPPASARFGAIMKYGAGPASYIGTTTVGTSTVVVTGWRTQ